MIADQTAKYRAMGLDEKTAHDRAMEDIGQQNAIQG